MAEETVLIRTELAHPLPREKAQGRSRSMPRWASTHGACAIFQASKLYDPND
jgi:hypothetical protein